MLAKGGIKSGKPTSSSTFLETGDPSKDISPEESIKEPYEEISQQTLSIDDAITNGIGSNMKLTEQQKRESIEADGRINLRYGETARIRNEPSVNSLIPIEKTTPSDGISSGTQLIDYIAQLPSVSEEKLQQTNLLDSSMKLLYDLMLDAKEKAKKDSNIYTVNAVCDCAKNLREMMKLKLEIYKHYK